MTAPGLEQNHAPFRRRRSLPLSFRDAFVGIGYVLRTQRNAQIQCGAGIAAVALGIAFHLSATDWSLLALTVTVVLSAEVGNTALEAFVDLISPEQREAARIVKDAAAGAVLLTSIGAALVGLFLFGPPLWRLLG